MTGHELRQEEKKAVIFGLSRLTRKAEAITRRADFGAWRSSTTNTLLSRHVDHAMYSR
jgi:hypothetical protein